MIVLGRASMPLPELLCETSSSPPIFTNFFRSSSQYADCQISDWNRSLSALLFLVWHEATGQGLVIKMLRPYQDTRYSLETLDKRQRCLLEALQRNRVFTPELYLGLAPVYHLDLSQSTICIGEVMEHPTKKSLDADTEYVLLMKPQDQETRLDYLLKGEKIDSLMPLVEYIADIHNHKVFDISAEESIRWGSYDYLMHKLEHNLELLDFLVNRCNHIDILSDFAMLIADVQAHALSPVPVNEMIDCYLQKTKQDNEVARGVLDYYVMEKAIVGTGISILYDDKQ